MRTVPLQQICDIQIGKTPSRSVPEYWGGELPWVTISDFAAGRIVTTTKERITRIGAVKSGSKRIPRGTLLLSFKLSLGKRTISGCDLFTNEAIAALHILDHDVADRDYLYWALGSINYGRLVDRAAKGKTLNKAKLKLLQVPLPTLAEQRRIAGILDATDALRAKRREALAHLDALLQSTFLDMFGDPATNPMGWDTSALGKVGEVVTGNTPSRKRPEYYGKDIEWIKSDNINHPSFVLTEAEERLSVAGKAVARTSPKGSILVTCIAGSPSCIGNAAIADREVAFNQQINAFVPGKRIALWFAFGVLWVGKRLVQNASTNSMKGMVSKSAFSGISIPIPPTPLQNRFAAIAESVERQKARQRTHLAELDTLFASLQSRGFRGDL